MVMVDEMAKWEPGLLWDTQSTGKPVSGFLSYGPGYSKKSMLLNSGQFNGVTSCWWWGALHHPPLGSSSADTTCGWYGWGQRQEQGWAQVESPQAGQHLCAMV